MSSRFISEPRRETPILYDLDTAVVGGGTAGCIAAIAAARTGASTVLVERFASLGGCPTTGRCSHLGNKFVDHKKRQVIAGLAEEVIRRVIREGGTQHADFQTLIHGRKAPPTLFLVDPEILSHVLVEMAAEAGVILLLHTYFCDPIVDHDTVKGIIVQNKSGRFAVMSKIVIDASGEADVATRAGVPYRDRPANPAWSATYGMVFRMGNVDQNRFMDFVLHLPANDPKPEYGSWLAAETGIPHDELRKDWYWRHFLDPQSVGWGIPRGHPGKRAFGSETLDWFRERWTIEGDFTYVGIHYFRDQLKQAVENGDLKLTHAIEGMGEMTMNFDGITGATWRKGEVVVNVVNASSGFDAFDSNHISRLEVVSRRRALELARFLTKYIPGFEEAHLVDMGAQTMTRHYRLVETEFTLTEEEIIQYDGYPDAVYMVPIGISPGFARQIPYRIMLPKKVENLLAVGKCIPGSYLVRAIPAIMAMGQAAGTAAALSVRQSVTPRHINIMALQAALKAQGVILDLAMEPYQP